MKSQGQKPSQPHGAEDLPHNSERKRRGNLCGAAVSLERQFAKVNWRCVMGLEGRGVPERSGGDAVPGPRSRQADAFGGCLLEGDAEQSRRERKIRRRALVTSTLLQAAILLTVIAVPFFGKVERIALADFVPIPPYHPYSTGVHEHTAPAAPHVGQRPTFCLLCPTMRPVLRPTGGGSVSNTSEDSTNGDDQWTGIGDPCLSGCINMLGNSSGPRKPDDSVAPKIVRVTHIDPALLTERVEPVYPALARQTRRSGHVELRAIISEDGRIESLEMVSGDVLFEQSAKDAVRRWRYRPMILNGRPVKVDTYITVNYVMGQ
jgi:TonB family protein